MSLGGILTFLLTDGFGILSLLPASWAQIPPPNPAIPVLYPNNLLHKHILLTNFNAVGGVIFALFHKFAALQVEL